MAEDSMKLSEVEKGQLRLLLANGYKYLARDEVLGLCAYRNKPRLCMSRNPGIKFRFWSSSEGVLFMHDDYFLGVGFDEVAPYQILENAGLRLCKPTKRAVSV